MKKKLTKEQKDIVKLKEIITNTFWMARRYAHGRHTYAPSMVREAYLMIKKCFPKLLPPKDMTILPIETDKNMFLGVCDSNHTEDYLYDCNEEIK